MSDDLYEHDVVKWAQRQAALLRGVARGERLNEAVDWPHVIEQLEDVGLSELRACESLLRQALLHLLKLHADPGSPAARQWRGEIVGFLGDARARYTASMAQRLDLAAVWRLALRQLQAEYEQPAMQTDCPFALADLWRRMPASPNWSPAWVTASASTSRVWARPGSRPARSPAA
jgi:hypothetical protein